VLRACRRLLRPGGRTAFHTIHPAPGLTPAQRRRASRDGPVAVACSRPHAELLEAAGFVDVSETDCTPEFAVVTRAWTEQYEAYQDDLVALLGAELFEDRQADRRAQLRAIEDGLLRRSQFVATRPEDRQLRVPGTSVARDSHTKGAAQ